MNNNHSSVEISVRAWVESLVVGLNLCPFARRELMAERVRFSVSDATDEHALLRALELELERLDASPDIATTLLIHPGVMQDFFEYNQFLDAVDRLLAQLGLEGIYQVASFHPDYLFAGTAPGDPENYTNRSPYPLLHLLREDSLEQAIASHPDVAGIPQRNIALMNELGIETLEEMLAACQQAPPD